MGKGHRYGNTSPFSHLDGYQKKPTQERIVSLVTIIYLSCFSYIKLTFYPILCLGLAWAMKRLPTPFITLF
jgi:hypothetical protein